MVVWTGFVEIVRSVRTHGMSRAMLKLSYQVFEVSYANGSCLRRAGRAVRRAIELFSRADLHGMLLLLGGSGRSGRGGGHNGSLGRSRTHWSRRPGNKAEACTIFKVTIS